MQLIIKDMTLPEAISFNYDELKEEIVAKVSEYTNLVYTDEQIKDAKKDLAELRKFTKTLSDERIALKKKFLEPYEEFEKKIKELDAIVGEPIALIDTQIKEYNERIKNEKREQIVTLFAEKNKFEWLDVKQIWNEKWLNASVALKAVEEEIDSKITQIDTDLLTLSNLPEFGFEATEVYKNTLNINNALSEGQRLLEIQKKKEEQLKAEEEKKKVEEEQFKADEEQKNEVEEIPVEEMPFSDSDDDFIPSFDGNDKVEYTYKIELSASQKAVFEQFLANSKIKFTEV